MSFHQFLILVLSMYACYYLVLICFDQFSGRRLTLGGSDVSEFVVAPRTEPVRIVPDSPKYQLDSDQAEEQDARMSDTPLVENIAITSTSYQAHDLGLETISASGGIPVASVNFVDWFKKAS